MEWLRGLRTVVWLVMFGFDPAIPLWMNCLSRTTIDSVMFVSKVDDPPPSLPRLIVTPKLPFDFHFYFQFASQNFTYSSGTFDYRFDKGPFLFLKRKKIMAGKI